MMQKRFLEFFSDTERLVESLAMLTPQQIDYDVVARRIIHTIKGNCSVFGIQSVAQIAHDIESRVVDEARSIGDDDIAEMTAAWRGYALRLHKIISTEREQQYIRISRNDYSMLLKRLDSLDIESALLEQVLSWQNERTENRLNSIARQLKRLAKHANKGPIEVFIRTNCYRIDKVIWREFWGSFSHILRNIVDHGLETAAERDLNNKAMNQVNLFFDVHSDNTVVLIADDGRGIDWSKIREQARLMGLEHATSQDLEQALLMDGITSREFVSESSGRGLGLAAVNQIVEGMGGETRVQSEPGKGTTFRFVFPNIALRAYSRKLAFKTDRI